MNQKIMNGTFVQPTSDKPITSDVQSYITVAYGKGASYAVPISPEGVIQPGPIRVLPCEWDPQYSKY